MSESDNPHESGPQSIDQYLEAKFPPAEADKGEEADDATAPEQEVAEEAETEVTAEADDSKADSEESTDATEEPEPEDGDGPQVLTVDDYGDVQIEIDGERTTIAELAEGSLRRTDYTRKTQALAEERKALEAERAQIAEKQRQIDAALLSQEQDEQEPDWEKLAEEDPIGWQVQKLQFDRRKADRERKRAEAQQRELENQDAFRRHTAQIAVEKVPDWADGETFAKNEQERRKLALEAGFGPEEYDSARDFRFAVLLEWALEGRKARETQATVEKKVSKPVKVMKPGRAKEAGEKEAAERAARKRKLSRPHSMEDHLKAHGYEV